MRTHANYLRGAFSPVFVRDRLIEELDGREFDLLVGTGLSGTMIVPVLAYMLGKRFAIVRKRRAGSHASGWVEGIVEYGDRWLLVDDLISSGKTAKRVSRYMRRLDRENTLNLTQAGVFLYRDPAFLPGEYK